jgi:hypothetical protein
MPISHNDLVDPCGLVPNQRNFKLRKQVMLTIALTKELDSTIEEVEFWQERYEHAMKTI